MNNQSMKPILIGAVVAAAIIGAFFLGQQGLVERDGPAERVGEQLDKMADELKDSVEDIERSNS